MAAMAAATALARTPISTSCSGAAAGDTTRRTKTRTARPRFRRAQRNLQTLGQNFHTRNPPTTDTMARPNSPFAVQFGSDASMMAWVMSWAALVMALATPRSTATMVVIVVVIVIVDDDAGTVVIVVAVIIVVIIVAVLIVVIVVIVIVAIVMVTGGGGGGRELGDGYQHNQAGRREGRGGRGWSYDREQGEEKEKNDGHIHRGGAGRRGGTTAWEKKKQGLGGPKQGRIQTKIKALANEKIGQKTLDTALATKNRISKLENTTLRKVGHPSLTEIYGVD